MFASVCQERMSLLIRCCTKDEGGAPRNRFEGEGFKPPTAAGVKSLGGERVGKRCNEMHQVSIKEMNESDPFDEVSKTTTLLSKPKSRSNFGNSMAETFLLAMRQPALRWHDFDTGFCTELGNLSFRC